MPTLFTRIINGEIPGDIVYQNDHVVAFRDIAPQAPVHIVLVTREETPGLDALPASGDHQHLLDAVAKVAAVVGLTSYRVVINTGEDAGQTVRHLHAHILGGRDLGPVVGS
ncbi:MAG: HIT domain-containing protein [Armatimonadetes bacterium]|nr:HIT domain-containing protein [Armatimonadota bacterium]